MPVTSTEGLAEVPLILKSSILIFLNDELFVVMRSVTVGLLLNAAPSAKLPEDAKAVVKAGGEPIADPNPAPELPVKTHEPGVVAFEVLACQSTIILEYPTVDRVTSIKHPFALAAVPVTNA